MSVNTPLVLENNKQEVKGLSEQAGMEKSRPGSDLDFRTLEDFRRESG